MTVSVDKATNTFSIGMAGYTFREFTVEKTIEMMKRQELPSRLSEGFFICHEQLSGTDY